MINHVVLVGRVGSIDTTWTKDDRGIIRLSVALSYRGRTDWVRVILFGGIDYIQKLSSYIQKGTLIAVEGRLRTENYQNRSYIDVVARRVLVLDRKEPKPQKSFLENVMDMLPEGEQEEDGLGESDDIPF